MAFLQRINNGEGRVEREFAAGRGRMDLVIFDCRPEAKELPWNERIQWTREEEINVVSC
jgi:hypothetical protein